VRGRKNAKKSNESHYSPLCSVRRCKVTKKKRYKEPMCKKKKGPSSRSPKTKTKKSPLSSYKRYNPFTCPNFQLLGGTAFLPVWPFRGEAGLGRELVGMVGTLLVLCLAFPAAVAVALAEAP
jgi:hypothetical protein